MMNSNEEGTTKRGWRAQEWASDVGISRTSVWRLMKDGKIESVMLGKSRIITTTPSEFIATLPKNL